MSRDTALVSADWVAEHLDDPKIVLVEVDEDTTAYDGGHIQGAVKINWKTELQDPVRRDFVNKEQFEALLSQSVANGEYSLFDREWFFDEVKRAEFGRAHGGFDVAVTRDDHDRRVRSGSAQLFQRFETVDSGKPNVEQDAAISASSERFQTLFSRGDGIGDEALVFHHGAQCVANTALVVNDQNRVHLLATKRHKEHKNKP